MTLPPIKAGVQESVQAYVLRRLVDAGRPMTSEEIMEGCPSHITPSSCSKAASRLYAIAVLGRQRLINGKKGVTYQWYIADLNRIPKDFCWEAHPERSHSQPRPRRKPTTEPSPLNGKCDGVAHIQEEPVDATQRIVSAENQHTLTSLGQVGGDPYIPGVSAPAGATSIYRPEEAAGMPPQPPRPEAPRPASPGIVVVYGGRAKQLSVADARAIYAQLKEVFG